MDISCDRNSLKTALSLAQRALAKQTINKSVNMILNYHSCCLELEGSNFHFAYNIELPVVDNTGYPAGSYGIDSTLFAKLIGRTTKDRITLSIEEQNLMVSSGAFSAKIPLIQESIPYFVKPSGDLTAIKFPAVFARLAERAVWAADKTGLKPNFDVCHVIYRDGVLSVEATDRSVAVLASSDIELPGVDPFELLLPVFLVEELARLMSEDMKVAFNDKSFLLEENTSIGRISLASRIIKAPYPDLTTLFNRAVPIETLEITASELSEMLNRLMIMPTKDTGTVAGDTVYPINMSYRNSQLDFETKMSGLELNDSMIVTQHYEVNPFAVKVDMKRLRKAIVAAMQNEDDVVKLHYTGKDSPLVVESEKFKALVMLMR
jgi:DNA polymerase III sliding clamp (beta) subunit (PCNA family)